MIIAGFLQKFRQSKTVDAVFSGLRPASTALIASSVLKLGKSTLKNGAAAAIFLCVLILANADRLIDFSAFALLNSPAVLIVLAGVAGFLLYGRKKGGEGK